jgi:hypothetical protein
MTKASGAQNRARYVPRKIRVGSGGAQSQRSIDRTDRDGARLPRFALEGQGCPDSLNFPNLQTPARNTTRPMTAG